MPLPCSKTEALAITLAQIITIAWTAAFLQQQNGEALALPNAAAFGHNMSAPWPNQIPGTGNASMLGLKAKLGFGCDSIFPAFPKLDPICNSTYGNNDTAAACIASAINAATAELVGKRQQCAHAAMVHPDDQGKMAAGIILAFFAVMAVLFLPRTQDSGSYQAIEADDDQSKDGEEKRIVSGGGKRSWLSNKWAPVVIGAILMTLEIIILAALEANKHAVMADALKHPSGIGEDITPCNLQFADRRPCMAGFNQGMEAVDPSCGNIAFPVDVNVTIACNADWSCANGFQGGVAAKLALFWMACACMDDVDAAAKAFTVAVPIILLLVGKTAINLMPESWHEKLSDARSRLFATATDAADQLTEQFLGSDGGGDGEELATLGGSGT